MGQGLVFGKDSPKDAPMLSLEEAYCQITGEERERSFLMTDPRQSDNPIVFANNAFVRLTGYSRDEVENFVGVQNAIDPPEVGSEPLGGIRG
jgi:PAS domain-containing protein